MIKLSRQKLSLLAVAAAISAFSFTAQAHELRFLSNGYIIGVGSHVEPVVHGQTNGNDFYAAHETVIGDINSSVFLDVSAGDTIELITVPVKLSTEDYNAPITQIFPALTAYSQTTIDDAPGLTASFTFPTAGTYGYIVFGEIKKVGYPTLFFGEKFVCGAGSRDTVYGTSFECAQ
ncbi:hypothetical protein [Methylovulum psychrotolerans]|uniref:PEP-CTERM sorting domain-containing protein n=1 Tax=Methylovulum psychrotolerans TaxID=1704499 RepID=A0A2S5CKH3_9GAMM|nr:hypothetical protein [Methylovulum psychrotolerans]POZ51242.1 hypothetical protein AADEFJLK_02688 [Methylovulum psychrotolerans]